MSLSVRQLGLLALSLLVISAADANGQSSTFGQLSGYPTATPQTPRLRSTPTTRPTVSPYLHLANQPANSDGTPRYGGVYQVLVRPQIEQREFTMEQEREIARIQSNMLQMQNQSPGQFTSGTRPTGHRSRFMSFSHFYPPVRR